MRNAIVMAGVILVAAGQSALSADAPSKPILVSAVIAKLDTKTSAQPAASRVTRETSIPEGSLEKFGSVGLPQ